MHLHSHHAIPKSEARRKGMKLKYVPRIPVCEPCQTQIHCVFTNHELEKEYYTAERIRSHPEMKKFIEWIRKTNLVKIQVRETRAVRHWRHGRK